MVNYVNMAVFHHACPWESTNKGQILLIATALVWSLDYMRRNCLRLYGIYGVNRQLEGKVSYVRNWFFQRVRRGKGYKEGHHPSHLHIHIYTISQVPHPSQKPPAASNPTQSPSQLLPPSIAAKINEIFSHQNEEEQWTSRSS